MKPNPNHCPFCKADLRGPRIPKKYQKNFGGKYFSRKIAIYSREEDRTVAYKCPDCGRTWDRIGVEGRGSARRGGATRGGARNGEAKQGKGLKTENQ